MLMPGRSYTPTGGDYRFGFNGKENDVNGEGNQQDYGMRIYDTRLGKFLSVDPITAKYPELSPYQFAGNMPIKFIDLDGLEPAEKGKKVGEYKIANVKGLKSPLGWTWTKDKDVNHGKSFWNQGCSTSFSLGNASKNSPDDDLTKTNHPEVYAFSVCPDYSEACNESNLKSAFTLGIQLENSEKKSEAQLLLNKFISGNNSTLSFNATSGMSELLSKDLAFVNIKRKFEKEALNYFNKNGTLDDFNGKNYLARPYLKDTWFMHTVMGGTQQFDAQIQTVSSDQIIVQYTVWDHFGAGINDAKSNFPGLPSMFSLQHNIPGSNYIPFIWNIQVNK